MSTQLDQLVLNKEVSVHSILADAHIEGYNELFNECNTSIQEKFTKGYSTTIYHSAMQNIPRYRPDPVFALVVNKTFLPITERDLVKALVSEDFSADYIRVAIGHLTRLGILENKKSNTLVISENILPPADFDLGDDALPRVRQLVEDAYSQGVARLDQAPEDLKNVQFVKVHFDKRGYYFVVPNPVFKRYEVKDLMGGEIDFLLGLLPLKEIEPSPKGYTSIRTAIFENMMKEPIFVKEYIDKAPDFVPDVVIKISRDVLYMASSHKFIDKNGKITAEGERLLNIRLKTPLATWKYVEIYDLLPNTAKKKKPESLWGSMLPSLQIGVIEEILREFINEWQKKANDPKWREDFLKICKSEDYYDMYQVARQLGLNASTVEQILRHAWQKGLCGITVSSHNRLY